MKDETGKEELGRRLCAAWLSYTMGIGLQYAYNRYAKGEEIGPMWLQVAEMLQQAAQHNAFAPTEKG